MPRLRNTKSGAIVSVTEEKATRLGAEWEPADSAPAKAPAKKAASSTTKKS
jgi:hypothetical protein